MNDQYTDQPGSFLSRIGATWRNAFRDIFLIVTSIVIAFTLDAWWSNAQERRRLARHLTVLAQEFTHLSRNLDGHRRSVSNASAATRSILGEMGRPRPRSFADSLTTLINTSYDVEVVGSQGGALSTILNSGDIHLIRDDSLAYLLAQWPIIVQTINSDNAILTASREQELRGRLIASGLPESAIASHLPGLNLPQTRFPFDPNAVLMDPVSSRC